MRRFQCVEQGDDGPVVVVVTDEDILRTYYPWWSAEMRRVGKADQISQAACIEDFVTVHWAVELV